MCAGYGTIFSVSNSLYLELLIAVLYCVVRRNTRVTLAHLIHIISI